MNNYIPTLKIENNVLAVNLTRAVKKKKKNRKQISK